LHELSIVSSSLSLSLHLFLWLVAHLVDLSYVGCILPWLAGRLDGEGVIMGMMARERSMIGKLELKPECNRRGSERGGCDNEDKRR
jgi:hypothetical protein